MAYKFSPSNSASRQISTSNTQSNINKGRIYSIMKPTVVLDEISIEMDRNESDTDFKTEDNLSLEYPLIKINEYIFSEQEIVSFSIDCTGFLPKICLTVLFQDQVFLARELPKDGDMISIAIRNRSDVLKILRNDYLITKVSSTGVSTIVKEKTPVTFFGELFVPGLKGSTTFSFLGTSRDALKDVAKRLELGFATNETDTNDSQVWMCASQTPEDYIFKIAKHAWKDNKSFYNIWIDIYYNLNFVNVNKQLISSEDSLDDAALLNNIASGYSWGHKTGEKDMVSMPKVFSNNDALVTTSFYITSWNPINNSSAITMSAGTKMICQMFEHNPKLFSNINKQKFWSLTIDPIYDENKIKSHILLRGRATYNKANDSKELARANYKFTDLYKREPWLGIQYTNTSLSNSTKDWNGNQHPNFLRSVVHNTINLLELDKLNIEISVQGSNLNVIKGDKIPIIIFRKDPTENRRIHKDIQEDINYRELKDFFYSGWYYVKGYVLTWTSNQPGLLSSFSQNFVLTRREWPTPVPVDPVK